MRLFSILYCILIVSNLYAQTYESKYDLRFRGYNTCGWDWLSVKGGCKLSVDEAGLQVAMPNKNVKPTKFRLSRGIILPDEKIEAIEIKVLGHSIHAIPLTIKLVCMDKNERLINAKSIQGLASDTIHRLKIDNIAFAPHAITIAIEAETENAEGMTYTIKGVELSLNGISMNHKNIKPVEQSQPLKQDNIIPFDKITNHLSLDKEKKIEIIGLGESTHGSKTIAEARNLVLKNLIQSNLCDLIATEFPFDIAMIFDGYVQDKFKDRGIVEEYSKVSFDTETFMPLLDWIRDYNRSSIKKIHFVGIDRSGMGSPSYELLDLYSQILPKPDTEIFYEKIAKKEFYDLISLTQKNEKLKAILDEKEIAYLKYVTDELTAKIKHDKEGRDSLMFNRLEAARKIYTNRTGVTVLLTHSAHLQKIEYLSYDDLTRPLGNYISRQYKSRYKAVNFNFGSGSYIQDSCLSVFNSVIDTLDDIPENSFEYAASQIPVEQFMYATNLIPESIKTSALIPRGGQNRTVFNFCSLKNRFDYVVFSQKSKPFKKHEKDYLHSSMEFRNTQRIRHNEVYKKYMLKVN